MIVTPIRESVIIMGTEIMILIDDHKLDTNEADGLYEGEIIYLRSGYESVQDYKRILGHECFHALCDILGIQLDHHTEEIMAHRVSTMFSHEL